jgi:hypothetical protein
MAPQSALAIAVGLFSALWVTVHFPIEYQYVTHVTLGQFGKQLGKWFLGCLGWCVGIFLLDLLPKASPDSAFSTFIKEIPDFLWFVVLTGFFTWNLRGTVIEFPKLKRGQWIFLNIVLISAGGLLYLSWQTLPEMFVAFTYFILAQTAGLYEALIEIGKSNVQSMEGVLDD